MVGKLIILGSALSLTLGGTIVGVVKNSEPIKYGEGNGSSMKFESLDQLQDIVGSMKSASFYRGLASEDEATRKAVDFGDDFHTLTLINSINRTYIYKNPKQESVPSVSCEEKLVGTKLDKFRDGYGKPNDTCVPSDFIYNRTEVKKISQQEQTQVYKNNLVSYYTKEGLYLDINIDFLTQYENNYEVKTTKYFTFDGEGPNYSYSSSVFSKERLSQHILIDGAIFVTEGTAYMAYNNYERNFLAEDGKYDNEKHDYIFVEKEFKPENYLLFDLTEEKAAIQAATISAISKHYGKFFDLRYKQEAGKYSFEDLMKMSEEEAAKYSQEELEEMAGDAMMGMVGPVLATYCENIVNEMTDIADIPLSQIKFVLKQFSKKDANNNYANVEQKGKMYSISEKNMGEFVGRFMDEANFRYYGDYDSKYEKYINDDRGSYSEESLANYLVELLADNSEIAKPFKESYNALPEESKSDHSILTDLVSKYMRTKEGYRPYVDTPAAKITFIDETAPIIAVNFNGRDESFDSDKPTNEMKCADYYTISNVDNTMIKKVGKVRLNISDVLKDSLLTYFKGEQESAK